MLDADVIRPIASAYHPMGGLAALFGNPGAPRVRGETDGGSGRNASTRGTGAGVRLRGRSQPGDHGRSNPEGGCAGGALYEGPMGGPGMQEMLTPTAAIAGMGLDAHVAADHRRALFGAVPGGHPSDTSPPKRCRAGPIAVVREGDRIAIDIPAKTITLKVPDSEIADRLRQWNPPAPKITRGYLARYARMVSSGSEGAVLR